jgi:hypothetical protein
MKKITVLMAAVLAIATIVAAGLTVLPSSVQEAQANPCANEVEIDAEAGGDNSISDAGTDVENSGDNRECNFIGPVELDED